MEEDTENIPLAETETDNGQCFLDVELEALQSIYVNEVEVIRNENTTCVSINLHPATADKLDEQYVMLTLKFTLDAEYPHTIPEINIRNPRGLSDEKLTSINQDLKSIAESKRGKEMLFEVIEAAKEHLTEQNRPCGECAICLCNFSEADVFTKTHCYHYFHSHCLARYSKMATNAEKGSEDSPSPLGEEKTSSNELLCPVCRMPIEFEGAEDSFPPPSSRDEEVVISGDILELQKKMADLYQKQVDKGGIIDIEAEKNKYLLEISDVPTRTAEEPSSSDLSKDDDTISGLTPSEDNSKASSSPSKTTSPAEERKKDDKKQSQHPKSKYSSARTNKNQDDYKSKPNNSDRDRSQKEAKKTASNEEEYSDDEYSVPKSSGMRSERNLYKRNERRYDYGPPRRYYEDDYSSNYHRYPNTRGGNRGRHYPSNGYGRPNYQDRGGYRGRGRPRYERETSYEKNYQKNSPKAEKLVEKASDDVKETEDLPDSPQDSSTHKNEGINKKEVHPKDIQDSCPDRDSRYKEDSHVKGKDYRDKGRSDRNQTDSYRGRRNYSDIRYSERDGHSHRRGSYDTRDGYGNSYGRNKNRGSYNNVHRQNSKESAQEPKEKNEETDSYAADDRDNQSSSHQKNQFPGQRSSYRGGRGNSRRNEGYHRQSSQQSNEGDDNYRNGLENSGDHKNSSAEKDSKRYTLKDEGSVDKHSDLAKESSSPRYPQDDYSRQYKDRRNYNSQRGGYRNPEGSRANSDYQSSDYRRNPRSNYDRPYRNDSYQYRNNNRQYSSNTDRATGQKDNSDSYQYREKNRQYTTDPVADRASAQNEISESNSREKSAPKTANEKVEPVPTKPHSSESAEAQLPATKPNATFASCLPKMPNPPPGFSNPLKRVVYGLPAANPPPGFSRN